MFRLRLITLVVFVLFSAVLLHPNLASAYDLTDLKADFEFLMTQTPVESALLFNVFGTNPDPNFQKHQLTDFQLNELCDGDCGAAGLGVNYATYYKGGNYEKARQFKMKWTLEIARASTSPQTIADIINNEQVDNVIIRIGTTQGSEGFDNPSDYANFLRAVAGLTSRPFYAIAGPNEPDIEHWAAPTCNAPNGTSPAVEKAAFYDCVGPKLATYMNSLISAGLPSNVRLLSPAFNLTSFMFNDDTGRPDGIPRAMLRAGANFGSLYAVAGNIYPVSDTMQNIWTNHVAGVVGELGRPVVITETGPWTSISELYAGYDISIYDAYNAEQDQFYIHPIKGLNRSLGSSGGVDLNLKTIRDDLIDQGYEARCATPGFKIELTQDGKDWMADYVEQFPPGAVFGGYENYYIRTRTSGPPGIGNYVRSWLAVDYREVQTPVFRDVSDKRFLTTSLEEFFGFKDTVIQENTKAELNSAAINSLLTNQQRCEASVRILLKQEEMCNKLVNPSACALYSRPVPQTNYTIKTMLDEYKALASVPHPDIQPVPLPAYTDPITIEAVCDTVVSTDWNETARQGFLNTPLTIDRAYRLAFLVTTIELKHPTYASMFNFYIHPNEGPVGGPSKPDDAILVNAFKVPDILTTTQEEVVGLSSSGNTPWMDSSKLTRNSLITEKKQVSYAATASAKKAELQTAANWYDTHAQTSSDEIFCLVGASTSGIGPPECKDELGKAVIDIVNAQTSSRVTTKYNNKIDPECPELVKEPATSVLDFGGFGSEEFVKNPPAQLLYTQEFGAELLHNIFEVPDKNQDPTGELDATHQVEPKGESNPSFAETWKPGDPDDGENPLGSPRDWGLKSLFHVTDRTYPNFPYSGCCDEREVKHFLVYPVGYDMETVQEVLAGTFFTTDQIEGITTAAEEFDRIQLSGDKIEFTGGTRDHTFSDDRIEPPNWNGQPGMIPVGQGGGVYDIDSCQKVYQQVCSGTDPVTGLPTGCQDVLIGYNLPCERTFGWDILQKGPSLSAGLVGGRFGFWLREVQKGLNTKVGTAREYLDSCVTVEQFLTGRCGQPVDPVPIPNPPDPNCTALSCVPPTSPPLPTIAATPPPGGCTDPTQDAIIFEALVNENREWKVVLTCPTCTNTWGDIRTEITLPTGESWGWGPNNLPVGGRLEYPCGGCAGHGSQIPAGFSGQWCVSATITSNSAGNQCGGTVSYYSCTNVP
jgi:hypothetical protein